MYVCVCQGITDRAIEESVLNGANSLSDVQDQLGVANACGSCAQMAKEIIRDTKEKSANFLPYAAA